MTGYPAEGPKQPKDPTDTGNPKGRGWEKIITDPIPPRLR